VGGVFFEGLSRRVERYERNEEVSTSASTPSKSCVGG
jgi:hypothetical protein